MIDDYLDGIEPIGFRESNYVIHCDGRKQASVLGVWYGYNGGFCGVCVDLISLADSASSDKLPYEGPHFRPDVVPLDQLNISCLPWMSVTLVY